MRKLLFAICLIPCVQSMSSAQDLARIQIVNKTPLNISYFTKVGDGPVSQATLTPEVFEILNVPDNVNIPVSITFEPAVNNGAQPMTMRLFAYRGPVPKAYQFRLTPDGVGLILVPVN